MFNTSSGLVAIWVRNINDGNVTREKVPKLSNLQEVVYAVLNAEVA